MVSSLYKDLTSKNVMKNQSPMNIINNSKEISHTRVQAEYLTGGLPCPPRTLVDIFQRTVLDFPDTLAIDTDTKKLSYRELEAAVNSQALALRTRGIGPGSRVGIRLPSGTADLYISILSTIIAGAAYVPVDFDDGQARASAVFEAAQVSAVISPNGIDFIHANSRGPQESVSTSVDLDDDAWIIFTSGSTGVPKGVAITHRSGAAFFDGEAQLLVREKPLGPGDRVLAGLSVSFDSSIEEMWFAWRNGATLVPASRDDMRLGPDLPDFLSRKDITVMSTVPSIAVFLQDSELPKLRLLIVGGEACSSELASGLWRSYREVWNSYGPTESTIGATFQLLQHSAPVMIGAPIAGTHLAVINEDGNPTPMGEIGELVIGGVGLGRYLDFELTTQKFRPLPCLEWPRAYFSGDYVQLTPEGLRWVGRRDEQVKVAGRRIELGEVEAAAQRAPGVRASAAIVRTDGGAKQLVCYVTVTKDFNRTAAIKEICRHLPSGVIPRLVVLDSFPLRSSGKIDRSALPTPRPSDRALSANERTEDGPIAHAWCSVLGITSVTADDDFFELGGSSISAAQVVVALRTLYPMCSVADLYRYSNFSEFSAQLESINPDSGNDQIPLHPIKKFSGFIQILAVPALMTLEAARWLAALTFTALIVEPEFLSLSWTYAAFALTITLLTIPGRVIVAGSLIRILLIKISLKNSPKGGVTHLRLWAAERIASILSVSDAYGTPWMCIYARILGCKIGRRSHLQSAPPVTGQLTLGDDCVVEPDVVFSTWRLVNSEIMPNHYVIGNRVRLGARTAFTRSTVIGNDVEVQPQSLVTEDIPDLSVVAGSPGQIIENGPVVWPHGIPSTSKLWSYAYGLAPFLLTLISALCIVPDIIIFESLAPLGESNKTLLLWLIKWSPAFALITLVSSLIITVVTVRLLARWAQPGFHSAHSAAGFASWLIEQVGHRSMLHLIPIYSTQATPFLFRLLGVSIGEDVECSTVIGQYHLMKIGSRSFMADDISLAQREMHRGWVYLAASEVGEGSLLGNRAYVRAGRTVPPGTLLAVNSELPVAARSGAIYFGVPAIEFPIRNIDLDKGVTAPLRLRFRRGFYELLRIVPMSLFVLIEGVIAFGIFLLIENSDPILVILGSTGILVIATLTGMLLTAVAKWIFQGRIKAGDHDFWSPFAWRSEFVWAVASLLSLPWMGPVLPGTPFIVWYHRLLGAKMGHGTWCEILFWSEPDNVTVGDAVTLASRADLQTHIFQGRTLRTGPVTVSSGSTVGSWSNVLLGSVIGENVNISANSVVPLGEVLHSGTAWWGHPIQVHKRA